MSYFITGATGFIGRTLLAHLVERDGTIYALVRKGSVDRLDEICERLEVPAGKVVPIIGDLTRTNCGLSRAKRDQMKNVKHFFHVAALYDIELGDEAHRLANVEGTRHAVELANALGKDNELRFHHISSIAVAGRYNGTFREDMFDEGQKIEFPYDQSKFESEQIVREELDIPWRVYRPGIVVGDSTTGEIDKIDGPYYIFKYLKRLRSIIPAWVPTIGVVGGKINMVPVDFVAAAIDHIAHKPRLDGRAFHLVDPYPPTFGESLTIFANAANAPSFSIRTNNPLIEAAPRSLMRLTALTPPSKMVTDELLEIAGLPRQMISSLDTPTEYDCTLTFEALKGSGIAVPALESYAIKLWEFWERNFDKSIAHNEKLEAAIKGKVVVITGSSSGIGEAVAHRVGRAGATAVLIARSREKLEEIKSEIEAAGGTASVHTADLADLADCDRVIKEILAEHGHVDVLINNAGRSIRRSVASSYDRFHDFERTMQLNYFGSLKLTLGFLPGMRKNQFGRIVNISSVGAQSYPPRFSAYVASKSALDAFSRCLAPEVLGDHIHITTVYMPLVKTPMIAPTTIYKAFPTITPQEAANLVVKGLISHPKKVTSRLGTLGEVVHAVSPRTADFVLSQAYRLFPESAAARGKPGSGEEISAEAMAFAHVMRGVHW